MLQLQLTTIKLSLTFTTRVNAQLADNKLHTTSRTPWKLQGSLIWPRLTFTHMVMPESTQHLQESGTSNANTVLLNANTTLWRYVLKTTKPTNSKLSNFWPVLKDKTLPPTTTVLLKHVLHKPESLTFKAFKHA